MDSSFASISRRDHPIDDKGGALLAVVAVFLVLTWVTVSLRFYVRAGLSHAAGADDYTMLAALLLFTIYSGLDVAGVRTGTGQHINLLTMDKIEKSFEMWLFAEILYILTSCVTRMSVAVFLLRVTVKRSHQIILWVIIIISALFNIFLFFYTLFQCTPVSFFWTRVRDPFTGHCRAVDTDVHVTYASSAVSAAADLIIALLPMAMLWDAQMDKRTKIIVMGILSMGTISGIAVLIRVPYVKSFRDSDFLYNAINLAIWSTVEPGIGITAGSLATLRPLIRTIQEKWKTRHDATSEHPTHSTRWRKTSCAHTPHPWDSEHSLSGVFHSTFREGALSRDGLRMNPQEDGSSPEVIRLQPIQERKRNRGFSDVSEEEGGERWEECLSSPVSSEGGDRAERRWEESVTSPVSSEGDCGGRVWEQRVESGGESPEMKRISHG